MKVENNPDKRISRTRLGSSKKLIRGFSMEDLRHLEGVEDEFSPSRISQRILDNAPISVITIDKKGYVTSANKYFKKFSRTKDFHRHNIFKSEFFIREGLVADYKKLLSDGTPVKRDGCHERNYKGEDKYLKILAVPLKSKAGKIEGILSMAIDNTETIMLKNRLQEYNKELEHKVEQRTAKLDQANKEMAKVLKLKDIFMADISHEMRTSLAIVQGNTDLLSRCKISAEESREIYEHIFGELKTMATMLADLTLLSNSDSAIEKHIREKVDVNRIISGICDSLKVVANENNVKIKYRSGKAVEMMADRSKLERLIQNLIFNAIRYNRLGGWVRVGVRSTKDVILLVVEDSGVGISEEHLPNIFERFYRVDTARSRKDGGTGLGLAICKWAVEMHGGTIDVSSKVGVGTVFTVRLPRDFKGK